MEERRHRLGVREKRIRIFTFDELSLRAQARAVKDFQNDPELTWDQGDSEQLTETFKEDLENHYHLGTMKVYWGLSHCQGDGVCFMGRVDVKGFIEAEKKNEEFGSLLLVDVSARITHGGRDCHWNSMGVDVESGSGPEDILSMDDRAILDRWENAVGRRSSEQRDAERARDAPIAEWRQEIERHRSRRGRLKQDWRPGPGPQPPPLDIPVPPDLEVPDDVKAIHDEMSRLQQDLDRQLEEFRQYLAERVKEISKELEKNGYAEMEYHQGEEYALERLENMDWEYLEDGKRYDG